jgi:tripeptidyl-peptidase-2
MPKAETEEKASFELKLALLSSKSWVLSPNHLIVWNGARQIKVEVEPRNLPSGVHFAEVMAYVPDDERGPLFRIPVTVVIPDQLTSEKKGLFSVPELRLEKDFVKRLFFHVPKEASWADLKLSNIVCESKTCITVHTVQIVPGRSFRENENKEQISAENNGSSEIILSVVSGYTMELCLSLYWSELRDVTLSVEVLFRCIHPSPSCLTFNSSNMWTSVNVTGFMREEEVFPEFKLTHRIVYKRPTSHKISPLGSRDVLPSGVQIYQLVLSYMFQLNQTTEVRPEFPLMSDLLYENPYSGQLWMVFNCNKQYKCAGDSYSRQYTTKLDKDDYILRLQVCHSKLSELKKLTDMPLCLHSKLSSSLSLEVTASRYDLMSGPTVTKKTLRPGISTRFYLRSLPEDKLAKCGVDQGDFLSGHFTFSKCDKVKKKVAYELKYIVGPRKSARSPSVSTEKKLYTNDSLKEFKINSMRYGVLTSDELEDEYGDDISFLLAKLRMVSESEMCSYSNAEALAASIYAKIDLNEILAQLHIQEQFSHVPGRECFEEKKRQLVECLTLEGSILFKEQPSSDRLKAIYVDLHKLLDKKDKVLKEFKMKYAEAMGHFATLAKMIEEEMSVGRASRDLDEKLIQCYRQLECKEYADLLEHNLTWKYPPDFVSF